MTYLIRIFACALVCLICSFSEVHSESQVTVKFEESNSFVFNDGMGYFVTYIHHRKVSDLPLYARIVYGRDKWRDLEPTQGNYNFEGIKKLISYWKANGVRWGYRVFSSDTGGEETPGYIFDSGVPYASHQGRGGPQRDPVFWHPLYMEKYSKFVRALGEAFEGGSGIEFLDMGGIGTYGEMNLSMWTKEELKVNGFSDEAYFDAYKSMIAAYKTAFPRTRLFLNISNKDKIAEYAASQGVGLRYDGLSLTINNSLPQVSKQFQHLSNTVPCMYEFAVGEKDPQVIISTIERALEDPISYLHLNLGPTSKLDPALQGTLYRLGRRLGFRPFLESITLPESAKLGSEFIIGQRWINTGSAPGYQQFVLNIRITGEAGEELHKVTWAPDPPTSAWNPGNTITTRYPLRLPSDLKDGRYSLLIRMSDPRTGQAFALPIEATCIDGFNLLSHFWVQNGSMIFVEDAPSHQSAPSADSSSAAAGAVGQTEKNPAVPQGIGAVSSKATSAVGQTEKNPADSSGSGAVSSKATSAVGQTEKNPAVPQGIGAVSSKATSAVGQTEKNPAVPQGIGAVSSKATSAVGQTEKNPADSSGSGAVSSKATSAVGQTEKNPADSSGSGAVSGIDDSKEEKPKKGSSLPSPGTQTKSQKGASHGSGSGAAGASLGPSTGHDAAGTLTGSDTGAVVGSPGGAVAGSRMDNQEKVIRDILTHAQAAAVSRAGNLLAVTFKADVMFDSKSTMVRPGVEAEVDGVATVLNQYPETLVRVEGHTDKKGPSEHDMELSIGRAVAVKNLLVQYGVAAKRIDVVGYGGDMPVTTNDTEVGREMNRRVEIKIAPKEDGFTKRRAAK